MLYLCSKINKKAIRNDAFCLRNFIFSSLLPSFINLHGSLKSFRPSLLRLSACHNLFSVFLLCSPNMGQALKKFGSDETKLKIIGPVLEECYEKYFADTKDWSLADFYHAVCLTIEEINKKLGSTQLRVPKKSTLEQAYQVWKFKENPIQASVLSIKLLLDAKHHQDKGKALTKEEFQKILQDVIMDTGVTGIGAKDTLMYIFGLPVTALFFKQQLFPRAIPNEIFIPGVTSAAVFLLAKLNKI